MTMKSDAKNWGSAAKFFHWIIVLLILAEGTLGLSMGELPKGPSAFAYFNLHKSIGITILALAVLRLLWRALDLHPKPVPTMPTWQAFVARLGHALLYALLFLVPLSGWWFDSIEGLRPMFWFGLFEVPHLVAPDPSLKHFAHEWHENLFWALIIVAAGHAAAALVHHFINRDATLKRMLPGKGRVLLGSTLALLIAALFAVPALTERMNPRGSRPSGHMHDEDVSPAAPAAPVSASASPVAQARAWTVDAATSTLGFKGTYQGEGFDGSFKRFDATIHYDEADLAHSAFDVNIDLASAETGSSERDDTLKGDDFFSTSKFPKAHFVTTSFEKGADGGISAHGTLTIRDKTAPVVLTVKFAANDGKATLDVDTVLKRTDYDLGAGKDWTDIGADAPVHGHLVLVAK